MKSFEIILKSDDDEEHYGNKPNYFTNKLPSIIKLPQNENWFVGLNYISIPASNILKYDENIKKEMLLRVTCNIIKENIDNEQNNSEIGSFIYKKHNQTHTIFNPSFHKIDTAQINKITIQIKENDKNAQIDNSQFISSQKYSKIFEKYEHINLIFHPLKQFQEQCKTMKFVEIIEQEQISNVFIIFTQILYYINLWFKQIISVTSSNHLDHHFASNIKLISINYENVIFNGIDHKFNSNTKYILNEIDNEDIYIHFKYAMYTTINFLLSIITQKIFDEKYIEADHDTQSELFGLMPLLLNCFKTVDANENNNSFKISTPTIVKLIFKKINQSMIHNIFISSKPTKTHLDNKANNFKIFLNAPLELNNEHSATIKNISFQNKFKTFSKPQAIWFYPPASQMQTIMNYSPETAQRYLEFVNQGVKLITIPADFEIQTDNDILLLLKHDKKLNEYLSIIKKDNQNNIKFKVMKDGKYAMDEELAKILGHTANLKTNKTHNQYKITELMQPHTPLNIKANHPSYIIIQCNFINNISIGSKTAPILALLPFTAHQTNQIISYDFVIDNINTVNTSHLQQLHFKLFDENNHPITFGEDVEIRIKLEVTKKDI